MNHLGSFEPGTRDTPSQSPAILWVAGARRFRAQPPLSAELNSLPSNHWSESPQVRQSASPQVRKSDSPQVRKSASPQVRKSDSPTVRQSDSVRLPDSWLGTPDSGKSDARGFLRPPPTIASGSLPDPRTTLPRYVARYLVRGPDQQPPSFVIGP